MRVSTLLAGAMYLEVVPSVVFWLLSPTDSVRTWYSNILTYIAAHALGTLAVASVLLLVGWQLRLRAASFFLRNRTDRVDLRLSRVIVLAGALVLMDVAGTLVVALLQIHHGQPFSLCDTGGVIYYLQLRGEIYLVLLTAFFAIAYLQDVLRRRGRITG